MLVLFADHESGDVLKEHQRDSSLATQLDEVSRFQGAFRKENALVCKNSDRIAPDPREAAHDRASIQGLELLEPAFIHDAGNNFANVIDAAGITRDDAIDLVRRMLRLFELG